MKAPSKIFLYSIGLLLLLVMGLFVFSGFKSSYLYKYDVKKDYTYDFKNSNAELVELKIKDNILRIEGVNADWNTAILELEVKSSFFGKFFQPNVNFRGNEKDAIQYFEQNCKGIRYIDLSSVLSGSQALKLDARFLRDIDQDVNIYLFNNPEISRTKTLVLSTHPDDGEIAAYGLYSNANDTNTHIVTITAGEAGPKTYDELYKDNLTHYIKKGEIRVWNSITIPMLAGIAPGNAINLGYFDGKLIDMYKDTSEIVASRSIQSNDINQFRKMNISFNLVDTCGVSNWTHMVSDIAHILKELKPEIILSPYPSVSNHPDHRLTTVALFEAIKKIGLKNGLVYLYANDNILGGNFYPQGKIYSLISLPPSFSDEYYFNSIYCHQLEFNEQNDKLLALEAMNDLRPDTEWRSSKGSIKKAFRTSFKNIFGLDRSYYRRAVRENEIFFVVDIANLYDDTIISYIEGDKK